MNIFKLNQRLSSAYITSDVFNCPLLRDDIHRVFDDATFVIVPKNGNSACVLSFCMQGGILLQLHGTFVATHKQVSEQSPPSGDNRVSEDDSSGCGGNCGRGRGRRGRGGGRSRTLGQGHAVPQRSSERLKLKEKGKPNAISISQVEAWKRAYPGLGLEISCTEDPAWNSATWYPGVEVYEEIRERALAERELELHRKEMLREGGVLWDDDDLDM
ncbi:hypothetical protein BGX38DRAFT_1331162 [Terfezia claveryi]|nr:hypothetical protein BGX38DRAFT_1331162 [Terfezia claveryi]